MNYLSYIFFTLILLSSCTGSRYNVLDSVKSDEEFTIVDRALHRPTIQVGQELCITVTSLNEESAKYFRASTEKEGATGVECLYYEVASDGKIQLPLYGRLYAQGYTLSQLESVIADSLRRFIKQPTVRAEYMDYEISVLGEVDLPGAYEFTNGEVTIYQALAEAGGLTQFADRKKLLIVRETADGIKHRRFDLTKDDLWETEYYYLKQNDVIMIPSNSGRIANSKNLPAWGTVLVGLGTVTAIIATR